LSTEFLQIRTNFLVVVKQALLQKDVTVVELAVEGGQALLLAKRFVFALCVVPLKARTGHLVRAVVGADNDWVVVASHLNLVSFNLII
jgi:hypothetical protein